MKFVVTVKIFNLTTNFIVSHEISWFLGVSKSSSALGDDETLVKK